MTWHPLRLGCKHCYRCLWHAEKKKKTKKNDNATLSQHSGWLNWLLTALRLLRTCPHSSRSCACRGGSVWVCLWHCSWQSGITFVQLISSSSLVILAKETRMTSACIKQWCMGQCGDRSCQIFFHRILSGAEILRNFTKVALAMHPLLQLLAWCAETYLQMPRQCFRLSNIYYQIMLQKLKKIDASAIW